MITVSNVSKTFPTKEGPREVLLPVDLRIEKGEFVAFVGPSGCGKSTLLNMIGGLITPSTGVISHQGINVTRPNTNVGYMTQAESLLPWRTAFENVELPLKLRGAQPTKRRKRVEQLLASVGLSDFAKSYPNELSGGMRKRVALAQVLAYDPETILMDEPFGALDAQLKMVMQNEILQLHEASHKTFVFVTHDLSEAIALADRIIIFSARPGHIKAERSIPLSRPRDVFRARFHSEFQEIYEDLWNQLAPEISTN
ncbi:MAG: ABC transporter ATP-binding protein [Rhizobiales bacterium 24-66-13]|jgi:NitT/TauT family transport system ATP-binding protein|nr:MAG: ABC transporter ATP-binding protein [Rhizobiales bacterium 35-66-30]OYZ82843.1 MAG: ABC transporter ATP-binding protein [Rhizobiales bacterium 24-66-13]OZB11389.1 MAG: ABC transporter ATP-binding protein [Rhizobiales bacterium 39-66-18]